MVYFVVHDENDSVGVVAVEGVKSGDSLAGWITDQNKAITVKAARQPRDYPAGGRPFQRRRRGRRAQGDLNRGMLGQAG